MPSKFDPQKHHRRSIRVQGYDYSQAGAYFITTVVRHREPLFGDVVHGEMVLNRYGKIVLAAWLDLPAHYPHIELGAFCVMPDHAHGIVILQDWKGSGKRHGLPEIVRAFKSFSARRINHLRHTEGMPVWQRNYYERIIRDERELDAITRYILANPSRWEE